MPAGFYIFVMKEENVTKIEKEEESVKNQS